ncbi:hypothetical protein ABZ923_09160 [Streptomyces sp. NPDC046881]|uniref:hypothetical protein n=1 Tax=Streptomyces sp. NPDC046881 TaxID=3155374 RepID=UPI0033E07CEA
MIRLRIKVVGCPRRALVLTDTPRPDCPDCAGIGGIESFYGDYDTGEYAGSDWEFCDCWTARSWTLLPLPRLLRRTWLDCYSTEPPF